MKADVLIFDGRHLLWRTSDAFKDLSVDINGEQVGTGGVYGFLACALRIHARYGGAPVVAWEGYGNFRRDLYPDYKRREPPAPDQQEIISDMAIQEKRLMLILRSIGVLQYYGKGFEADDVIGSVAAVSANMGKSVVIYTGDSDLRQLVTEKITVVSPGYRRRGDVVYDSDEVESKHGVPPELLADLKALAGDKSDNIPGIRGIGPKIAATALRGATGIEDVIRAAQGSGPMAIPERFRKAIVDGADDIRLFKKLTTIETKASIGSIPTKRDSLMLRKQLMLYRFRSLIVPNEFNQLVRMGE